MLSWALRRNSDSARDAQVSGMSSLSDRTPEKTALFGTPAPKTTNDKTTQQHAKPAPLTDKSPAKPPGILLTPGTGTTRRKRVSFNHDVKKGSAGRPDGPAKSSTTGLPDECPGKFPSPWPDRSSDGEQSRLKTRLQLAMENARKSSSKENGTEEKDFAYPAKEPEDLWEEVDDDSEFEADVTTDLNEPHSRSGKYWKSYFETYHTDAKAEMEKLVKYKQLAKSYAKMKDMEALELNQKLKEEQEKVKVMEEKVAELTRQASLSARRRGDERNPALMDELVGELEALLQENIDEAEDERPRRRRTASPRTQRTLMETQRELRRARSQRDRLRSDLKFAEQRASNLAEENRKLSTELSQNTSRIRDLEKQLEDSKTLYEKLKDDAKARYLEAQQVLQKKNEKVSELQREIERSNRSTLAKSLDEKVPTLMSIESLEDGGARPQSEAPADSTKLEEAEQRRKRGTEVSDATLAQSRALREKLEAEFGTKGLPATSVFSDRGNLQESRSSASSGRSAHTREDQPYPSRPDRPSRSTWAATSTEKTALDDLLADTPEKRISNASLEQEQQTRRRAGRPQSQVGTASHIEVAEGPSAPLGNTKRQSSAVGSMMNTIRPTISEDRKAAALARLQRKKAERAMQRQFGFAFSSGLESYLAHHHQKSFARQQPASFTAFLPLSISSYASTTLPYVLAAHRDPSLANLAALDDTLDASIVCTVGRRASVAQGRALLSIWERSFVGSPGAGAGAGGEADGEGVRGFSALLRISAASSSSFGDGGGAWDADPLAVAAHLPPLFGAICALVGLGLEQTAYVFLLGHVKALVSAAVRAGVFGPYQAQKTLASGAVQELIRAMIEREWETRVEDAGQNVPVMDLWVGRHEVLYSRIFNS
ncbi:putative urease accessory protein UreF-like protein [Achaetomium macrosporum]|uniref:Urease accessory protein UreF-like protein n=1 Tax=Achaetomium macrosporum TaxID=79813 RepID=A0AAN7CBU4_9PEZI|nr:putative urease accessory protein UreF-like protein [Achaetomium macrosporum]